MAESNREKDGVWKALHRPIPSPPPLCHPISLTTLPNDPTRNSRSSTTCLLHTSMAHYLALRDKNAARSSAIGLPEASRAHRDALRISGLPVNASKPCAKPHPGVQLPNSRTSTCLQGPCDGPALEPREDYRGSFTAALCIAHTMGVPVRQFGGMCRREEKGRGSGGRPQSPPRGQPRSGGGSIGLCPTKKGQPPADLFLWSIGESNS